jgi:hypothetical protein
LTEVRRFFQRFSVFFDLLEPAIEIQSPLRQLIAFVRAIVEPLRALFLEGVRPGAWSFGASEAFNRRGCLDLVVANRAAP